VSEWVSLFGTTKENYKTPQSRQPVSWWRCELGASWMWGMLHAAHVTIWSHTIPTDGETPDKCSLNITWVNRKNTYVLPSWMADAGSYHGTLVPVLVGIWMHLLQHCSGSMTAYSGFGLCGIQSIFTTLLALTYQLHCYILDFIREHTHHHHHWELLNQLMDIHWTWSKFIPVNFLTSIWATVPMQNYEVRATLSAI